MDQSLNVCRALIRPIVHPIETIQNVCYAVCHPIASAKVIIDWANENPLKVLFIVIGGFTIIAASAALVTTGLALSGVEVALLTTSNITWCYSAVSALTPIGEEVSSIVEAEEKQKKEKYQREQQTSLEVAELRDREIAEKHIRDSM